MKHRRSSVLFVGTIFLLMMVVSLIFFLSSLGSRRPLIAETSPDYGIASRPKELVKPGTKSPTGHAVNLAAQPASATEPPREIRPGVQLSEFSDATLLIVSNAVRCFQHIETLKIEMASKQAGANVERTLGGLQSKLFEADWALAALHDPRINRNKATDLLASLAEGAQSASGFNIEALLAVGSDLASPVASGDETEAIKTLHNHYLARLNGVQPEFLRVATVLDGFTTDRGEYLNSDLLKDAWSYVASSSWLAEQRREMAAERETKLLRFAEIQANQGEESARAFQNAAEDYTSFVTRDLENLRLAHDAVFGWRFREIHGLDDVKLIEALAGQNLAYPSPPDLRIPSR